MISKKIQLLFGSFILNFLLIGLSFSQGATIKGTIKDSLGKPINRAQVILEGKSRGATTNENGFYELTMIDAGAYTLIFRAPEFADKKKEITLTAGETQVHDMVLSSLGKMLDDVVIIGYGTTRTSDLTGSATILNEKNFNQMSVATPEQLIMGKAAGVKINTNDGAPGSGSTIRLRGGTSINASNDPLIVVDGVPLDNGGISGAANPLSMINPNDIASFVILKDASATAIYGSRGANGVILITTKKGNGLATEELKVTLDTKQSLSTIAKYADVLSGDEFRQLVTANGTQPMINLLGDANTDWQKEVFRNAFVTDNNVSLTGGIKGLPYRLSVGNRIENGILKRDQFNRTSVSLNLTPSFLDNHLQLEMNHRFAQTYSFFANRGALGAAFFDPTQPVMSGDTTYNGYSEWLDPVTGLPNTLAPKNPLGLIYQRDDRSNVSRYIGNAKLTYKLHFFPQIKAVLNLGTDQSEGAGYWREDSLSSFGIYSNGRYSNYRQNKGNKLIEAYANYNNSEKQSKHFIDLTAGYSYQDWYTSSPNYPIYNEAQDSIIQKAAAFPFYTKNALLSFYGRAIYTFDNRYVINASLRRDGSSRFSPETRWGMFPSVSAAWIISNEKFMEKLSAINMLKIRAGYGVTGQQDGIGDYAYISNYFVGDSTAMYAFAGQYFTLLRPGGFDANLKWETTTSYNIGLDLGLKNDRFTATVDLYRKETSDLLAVVPVPAGTNFSNQILTNVGGMRNEGIELSTTIGIIAKQDMRLDLSANATFNRNTVLKLSQIEDTNSVGILVGGIAGGIGNTVQVHSLNNPTFSYLVYEQQYDANGNAIEVGQQANIDINGDGQVTTADKWKDVNAFADLNGDGIINIDDRYVFEKAAPDWFLGMALNFTYKKWFLGLSMRSELGGYIYNNLHSNSATFQSINGTQGFLNNISSLYYNQEIEDITDRQLLSDMYLERADFLRMDYINLGYNFGKLKLTKEKIGLNASFTVSNVFVVTKYSGQDPEVNGGIDNNFYPRPRVYSLNLTFDF
jgi:TonB-linked SusC/RagA family outer membrane protein